MAAFDGRLDILRINVAAVDNDEVFEAARNKQLTMLQKSEVAGPEKRTFAARQVGLESPRGFLGAIPVTVSHGWARNPNLTNCVRRARDHRFRIDDDDSSIADGTAASNQSSHTSTRIGRRHNAVVLKRG